MAQNYYKVSAPGSVMLMGEHAVVYGHQAIVCAVDKRITVKLTPRKDSVIEINSALGNHQTSISKIKVCAPFEFILNAVLKYQKKLKTGFDCLIESEIDATTGLGSSAAVSVAFMAALLWWLEKTPPDKYSFIIHR